VTVLSDQDLVSLGETHDIITLGMMADEVRLRLHGARTTFVRVAQIAIEDEAVEVPESAGELRIVGAPSSRQQAIERVRTVAASARGIPVSGFSLADLEHLTAAEGVTLRSFLEDLCSAGLELIADAPFDRLQDPRRSIEEVNISGLAVARLTIQQLPSPDSTSLFKRVADLQRRVGVLRTFAPLARTASVAAPTTGYDDVKRVALARLIVDNIPSIQVDWALYGPKLAQVVLTMGADDVDGVAPEGGTAEGRRRAPLEEIRRNIRAAGHDAVERNGRFDLVAEANNPAAVAAARITQAPA
jgi:aminodeoxyfutalosine synthase